MPLDSISISISNSASQHSAGVCRQQIYLSLSQDRLARPAISSLLELLDGPSAAQEWLRPTGTEVRKEKRGEMGREKLDQIIAIAQNSRI